MLKRADKCRRFEIGYYVGHTLSGMTDRRVVTIDGLAGSGKSTLARELAKKLGFVHLNTGLLYRAVGFLALEHGVGVRAGPELARLIAMHRLELKATPAKGCEILIDGSAYGERLHMPEVSEATSIVSSVAEVRQALVQAQREAFPGQPLVAEGRDMGSIIFADAALKFFVQAELEVRVARRLAQYSGARKLAEDELNLLKKEMEREIIERDERDQGRALAPAKAASDALIVDNSSLTLTQVLENMYAAVAKRGLV